MDKPFNKNVQQPYIPRGSTIFKPVIPEKKPSDELVNNLFLTIADGNYFKMKEFMFTNNMLMNVKNGSGESALHLIIKNSNITPYEKKDLIILAINKGAQVNAYDVNNISPLHLACKYQLVDIIKILLQYGANVNALDNQYKSPLHYVTLGENTECPKIEKIKPLIPLMSNVFKTNKIDFDKNNYDLNFALREFFVGDTRTSKFLKHIKQSVDSINEMFPFELKKLQEKNKQEIIDILINSAGSDDYKSQEVFTKLTEIKTSLIDYVNSQIKMAIDPLTIKSNLPTGWGPDTLQQNRVLEYTSLEDFLNKIDRQLGENRHALILELQRLMGRLDSEINDLKVYNVNCDRAISHCHIYSHVIGTVLTNDDIKNMTTVKQLLCEDTSGSMIINVPVVETNLIYNFLTRKYHTVENTSFGKLNFNLVNISNISRIRMSKSEAKDYYETTGNKPSRAPFRNDNINYHGPTPPNDGDIVILQPLQCDAANVNTQGLYFNTKIKLYASLLKTSYMGLKSNVNTIMIGIDGDQNYPLPVLYEKYVSNAIVQLLNITLLIAAINDLTGTLKITFLDLHRVFTNMTQLFDGDKQNYLFLLEQITDDLENMANENLVKICDDIYSSVRNIAKKLNDVIAFIEGMSASKCIDAFAKYDTFDNFYSDSNNQQVTDIVIRPLQKIVDFPDSLSFVNLNGPNVVERRKYLIENYMMQVTLLNLPIGIVNTHYTLSSHLLLPTEPKLGYLGSKKNISLLGIDKLNADHDHKISIAEVGRDASRANDPDPTLAGSIGYISPVINLKHNFEFPIIGVFYSYYLHMLKYAIVRHIINKSYKFITTSTRLTESHEIKLQTILLKLKNDIKKVVKFDESDHGAILTIVGRSIDKCLINFINDNVVTKINQMLLSMIKTDVPKHYSKIFDVTRKMFPILNPDIGMSVDLNEMFTELLDVNLFNEVKDIAVGNLNEEHVKPKKIHRITNFDSNTSLRNEICYKYDQSAMEALFEFNVQVNTKDAIGNTPLYYAIETQNILAIKKLKSHGAIIYSTTSTNKFGQCALEYAWSIYSLQLQKSIGNKYEICLNATDKIIRRLKSNEKYSNNVPKYSSLILPMTLYLLNHQFYLIGKNYANGWTFSNNEEFEKTIGLKTEHILPLLEVDLDIEEFEPKSYIESAKFQRTKKNEQINMLTQKRANLTEELRQLHSKNPMSSFDTQRSNQIGNMIINIDSDIGVYTTEVAAFDNQIQKTINFSTSDNTKLKTSINVNKQYLTLHDENVTDIYNSVFVNVINYDIKSILNNKKYYYSTDMRTYPSMWKKYFANPIVDDYTQIIDHMIKYQKKVADDNNTTSLEKVNNVRIISRYYSQIINPFVEHYFDLEQTYDETNYALTKVIDIICHVIKHTLCINLFGFIVKSLTKFTINAVPKQQQLLNDEYAQMLTKIVIEIIDSSKTNDEGSALMNYIFTILPLKLVKATLGIYEGPNEGEDDIDRRLTPESIFNHINKILESATTIGIKDKSSLMLNLREYAYPFYIDYSTTFIKEMKNLVDSYMRQLQGEFNMLNILEELLS